MVYPNIGIGNMGVFRFVYWGVSPITLLWPLGELPILPLGISLGNLWSRSMVYYYPLSHWSLAEIGL